MMAARELLMPRRSKVWQGWMDASLMVFDGDHSLRVLAAAFDERRRAAPLDYINVEFPYGDGVAGRSFKTNQIRVYVRSDDETDEPSYYTPVEGVPAHRVLISFPIQAPDEADRLWDPYGVVSLGSTRADCPLRLVQPGSSEWMSRLSAFKANLDVEIYQSLTAIFLDSDAGEALTGPPKGA